MERFYRVLRHWQAQYCRPAFALGQRGRIYTLIRTARRLIKSRRRRRASLHDSLSIEYSTEYHVNDQVEPSVSAHDNLAKRIECIPLHLAGPETTRKILQCICILLAPLLRCIRRDGSANQTTLRNNSLETDATHFLSTTLSHLREICGWFREHNRPSPSSLGIRI